MSNHLNNKETPIGIKKTPEERLRELQDYFMTLPVLRETSPKEPSPNLDQIIRIHRHRVRR